MGYLQTKYKDKYRLMVEYDKSKNQFARKLNGNYEDIDVYIKCKNDIRIFHYGGQTLQAYIPSVGRGLNILRQIYRDYINESNVTTDTIQSVVGEKVISREIIKILDEEKFYKELEDNKIVSNFERTDAEVLFCFPTKYMEEFEKYFSPCTNGASISPFSSKNLPKNKTFKIPEEDLNKYEEVKDRIGINNIFALSRCTKEYLKSLAKKKNEWEKLKDDMALKMLKGKEYIYSIDKWEQYIAYLNKNIDKYTIEYKTN